MDDAMLSLRRYLDGLRRRAAATALTLLAGLALTFTTATLRETVAAPVDLQPPLESAEIMSTVVDAMRNGPLVVTPVSNPKTSDASVSPAQLEQTPTDNEAATISTTSVLRNLFTAPPLPEVLVDDAESPESYALPQPTDPNCEPTLQQPLTTHHSQAPAPSRCGDELWYISSRHLDGAACCDGPPALRVWRGDGCGDGRTPSSLAEFYAHDDPNVITIIYAHGARVTEYRAFARLPLIYDALVECLPPDVRVRMVMFSWPNRKSVRVVKDFRQASVEAAPHSQYLAHLVANIDPEVRVSLMSFSLGAQLVTGALETLSADGGPFDQRRVRVVMWTAAETNTWLQPGGPHGRAMLSVDRLLLVNNPCDPVLKRYALMSPCTDPAALGFCGLPNLAAFGADALRIRQFDGGPELGATHGYRDHLEAPNVVALTRPYVFWQDVDATCQPAAPLEVISSRPQ